MSTLPKTQIQCNPYQNYNGIFPEIEQKNLKAYVGPQKTPHGQNDLEKEQRKHHISWFQSVLQCYSHQNNMVLT